MIRPEDDHMYWADQASKYNTQAERKNYLVVSGFTDQQRIDCILHLAVSYLPRRMHHLPNKLISKAWHDLPCKTTKTMFAIGIKSHRKKGSA
jgi:hypothetical protein|tara:strand:- start:298 stop:573 length:276 start_codon:yes stop_codon:yes gene_type:complete